MLRASSLPEFCRPIWRALITVVALMLMFGATEAAAKTPCVGVVPITKKLLSVIDADVKAIKIAGLPPILVAELPYLQAEEGVAMGLAGMIIFFRKSPGRDGLLSSLQTGKRKRACLRLPSLALWSCSRSGAWRVRCRTGVPFGQRATSPSSNARR